jgi:hypothetical protein
MGDQRIGGCLCGHNEYCSVCAPDTWKDWDPRTLREARDTLTEAARWAVETMHCRSGFAPPTCRVRAARYTPECRCANCIAWRKLVAAVGFYGTRE